MAAQQNDQFLRKVSLLLLAADKPGNNPSAYVKPAPPLDLSEMRITFETRQEDEQSPNNASIRVYNLSQPTMQKVQGEYSRVILQAGYQNAGFGVIFDGNIKQYRIGRVDAKNTYIDLLCADGDQAYNFAMVSKSLKAGSKPTDRVAAARTALEEYKIKEGTILIPGTGGILPRGKVLFGLAKDILRQEADSNGVTWNISNGVLNMTPLDGYLPGEAVILTAQSGLLGRPEQTQEGIRARCLINPRISVGTLVKIDNKSINQTTQHKDAAIPGGQVPYNQYAGLQMFADVSADGLYRVYVVECNGDTRALPWWMELTLLAVDPSTMKVKAFG